MEDYSFGDVVAAYTGSEFVPRPWLTARVEAALADARTRYVLLTAEPGAGKTGFLANLAADHPQWPRYFIRRDSAATVTGGDARSFLLAIGHQLAWHHPELFRPELLDIEVRQQVDEVLAGGKAVGVRIDDLTVSPFYRTAALRLEQAVGSVQGDLVGVEIGRATLDPRLLETANLAHLALIAPATALAAKEPSARLTILVDALDEIADQLGFDGLLSWLESGPQLPPNVRLVLTSRAHSKLELFRRRRAGEVVELTIDTASPQVRADLMRFADRLVSDHSVAQVIRAQGGVPEDVAEEATDRAEGNFAYLVAYARALTEAIARLDDEFRDRLLRFADVPMGLDSLYGLFMEQIRNDVSRMGMMAVAEPAHPQDTLCPAWEAVAQPLLGVLVVARDALTLDQLMSLSRVRVWRRDAANVVTRLRQFLDSSGATMRLFHGSLVEFLVSPSVRSNYPQWAVEPAEWHERIVAAYQGDQAGLAEVDWTGVDDYGLRHLPVHVTRSRARVADQVMDLIRPPLKRAMKARFGTDAEFLALTELAAGHATTTMPPSKAIPAVFEIGAAVQYIRLAGPELPASVLGALAATGRADDAVDRIGELADPMARVRALDAVILRAPQLRDRLLRRLTADARSVTADRNQDPARVRRDALAVAAKAWAPVDHARALRLAHEGDCDQDTLDAIHLAAARSHRDPQPLSQVRNGRSEAYHEMGLIAEAEQSLADEPQPGRLRAMARLAAYWQPIDPQRAAWFVRTLWTEIDAAVAAELVRTSPKGAEEIIKVLKAAADSAVTLTATHRDAAGAMLSRIEQVGMNGLTRDALWRTAGGWLAMDEIGRAKHVVGRFTQAAMNRTWQGASDLAQAAELLFDDDPEEGQRLAQAAYEAIGQAPSAEDMVAGMLIQSQHASVARHLARPVPPWAIEVAQRMRADPGHGSRAAGLADRLTVLGELAQAFHDSGDAEAADELLAECLADGGDLDPDLIDETELPFRTVQSGPTQHTTGHVWAAYGFNIMEQWRLRSQEQVFTRPADILRAVMPGGDSIGTPYTWDRALRVLAVAAGTWNPVARLGDLVERGIGLATVTSIVREQGSADSAADLADLTVQVISKIPGCAWKAPMEQLDPDGVADYLLPDQRVRFEASMVRVIDGEAVANPLARRVLRAEDLLRYAQSAPASEESVQRLHGFVGEVLSWPSQFPGERLLVNVTAAGLIAAERVLRSQLPSPLPVPPLAVPSQLYAAVADLLALRRGLPVQDRLQYALKPLLEKEPAAAAHLAALSVPFDPSLAATVSQALAEVARPSARTRILVAVSESLRPSDPDTADARLDEALAQLQETLRPGEYGEMTRLLYPRVVAHRPNLAASWLLDAFRDRWAQAMSILDAAAPELVALCGPDIVTELIAAYDRARAFGASALSPV